MFTKRVPINYFLVSAYCGNEYCHGNLIFGGMALMSDPPQYPHRCEYCGKTQNLNDVYPRTEHEEIK